MSNDWKSRLGMVYSTNPDFEYKTEEPADNASDVAPRKQNLRVALDRRNRGGKQVTIVDGFVGATNALETLGKTLKTKCGVGGAVKDGQIIIQGDHRDRIVSILVEMGFKARKI